MELTPIGARKSARYKKIVADRGATARKLWAHLSSGFPDQQMFAHMYDRLQRWVTRRGPGASAAHQLPQSVNLKPPTTPILTRPQQPRRPCANQPTSPTQFVNHPAG